MNIHTTRKYLFKYYINILLYVSIFITTLIFVRFNIINSIHNFLNLESQNQFLYYIMYFYILIIILLLNICLTFFYKGFFGGLRTYTIITVLMVL